MSINTNIPASIDEAIRRHERDINIPYQLTGCRFIKVTGHSKIPMDKVWYKNSFGYNDPELLNHINKRGENYGVLLKNGVCAFDCDAEELYNALPATLKESSLVVKTGRINGGYHVYFICHDAPPEKYPLNNAEGKSLGDVRFTGHRSFLIGAGSVNKVGNQYRVIKDNPLAELSREEVMKIIDPFVDMQQVKAEEERSREEIFKNIENKFRRDGKTRTITEQCNLRVLDFLKPDNPIITGRIIRGAHPIHGSETGRNFEVDTDKNLWHCYRCETGGDALLAYAVSKGIVQCCECTKGFQLYKDKERWKAVLENLERDGYLQKPHISNNLRDLFRIDPDYEYKQFVRGLQNYKKTIEGLKN